MSERPAADVEPADPSNRPPQSTIERVVPYVLLAMGIVLFIAMLASVAFAPELVGWMLGGTIVFVALAAVINRSDELDLGRGLLRSSRRRDDGVRDEERNQLSTITPAPDGKSLTTSDRRHEQLAGARSGEQDR